MMKRSATFALLLVCVLTACSPRDFLTRRLAADLIAGSEVFRTPQQIWLRTGVVSNKDYVSPQYLVLQRHGWIVGSNASCTPETAPSPCWEVTLTPLGVETLRDLVRDPSAASSYFSVPTARRALVSITGISKEGNIADVDFRWKWMPLNEVGSALYTGGVEYDASVGFKHYDDGWRLVGDNEAKGLENSLKNSQPVK